MKTDFDAHFTD